mgnify:CR=1 FL=1
MHLQQFNIPYQSVEINRDDIYAVLGVSPEMKALVDEYIDEVFMNAPKLMNVRGGYLVSEEVEMDNKLKGIFVKGIPFNVKKIIFQQLFNNFSQVELSNIEF